MGSSHNRALYKCPITLLYFLLHICDSDVIIFHLFHLEKYFKVRPYHSFYKLKLNSGFTNNNYN